MAYNYVASSQEGTTVVTACTGQVVSTEHLNLIIGKPTHVEIMLVTPEGLKLDRKFNIFGRIAGIKIFRPQNEALDWMLVSTESLQFCILAFDQQSGELITKAKGNISSSVGRRSESEQLGFLDPNSRCIAMRVYEGQMKVIPMDKHGKLHEAVDIRLADLEIADMKFLHGFDVPTFASISVEDDGKKVLKTYKVHVRAGELGEGPWPKQVLDRDANILVPVPLPSGGVLVVGAGVVEYCNGSSKVSASIKGLHITTIGVIDSDGSRYLIGLNHTNQSCVYHITTGDEDGVLRMLVLIRQADSVTQLKVENLGVVSAASCICYLDEGVVYIGSEYGDSQLVKLNTQPNEQGSFLEVLQSFTNIGPISDFTVVDQQSQTEIVTCSGSRRDGSLRVIRGGIGIHELASIELPGIQGIWPIRGADGIRHEMLVVSFVDQTGFLGINHEELEGKQVPGAETALPSLFCTNVAHGQWVQVTEASARLLSCASGELLNEWAPADKKISVCSGNTDSLFIASGADLFRLDIGENLFNVGSSSKMEHEVACISSHVHGQTNSISGRSFVTVGLWTDNSIRVLRAADLAQVFSTNLGGTFIPRSIVSVEMEGVQYTFCGLGDGSLVTFTSNPETGSLCDDRKVTLGTQPIELSVTPHGMGLHVFASSDRPSVIYSRLKSLLFAGVNQVEVLRMCSLDAESFPDSVVLVSKETLTIGKIEDIQKFNIQKIPLGETPWRIAHQAETRFHCVLTTNDAEASGGEGAGFVRIFDSLTLEPCDSYALALHDFPTSILSLKLGDDPTPYFVVGTAEVKSDEDEPINGKLLVFHVVDRKLILVTTFAITGTPYTMCGMNGMLLVGINSKLQLFRWVVTEEVKQLSSVCVQHGGTVIMKVSARGAHVLVADMMRSLTLYVYKEHDHAFDILGTDTGPNWMSTGEFLDDDVFLGAETSMNLFVARRVFDAADEANSLKLEVIGEFHLGHFVNVLTRGSLAMKAKDPVNQSASTLLFGTASGAIGSIISISSEQFELLNDVQKRMVRAVPSIGGFEHSQWRAFQSDRRPQTISGESLNFIDGDFIETFVALSQELKEKIVDGISIKEGSDTRLLTVEDLTRIIEEFARLH